MKIGFLQIFYTIFSAVLISLAIPNEIYLLGFPLIGLFSLVPFYFAIATARTFKKSFFLGFLHAFSVHIFSSFWLGNFRNFAGFTLGASALGTGAIEALCAMIMFIPFSSIFWKKSLEIYSGKQSLYLILRPLYFTASYCVYEFMKSTGWLGYPWGTLSSCAAKWHFITQIASITGALGVSFLFALFSCVFAEGIILLSRVQEFIPVKAGRKKVFIEDNSRFFALNINRRLLSVLFGAALIFGIVTYVMPQKKVKQLNAILVQQNLDPWITSDSESVRISDRIIETKKDEFDEEGISTDLVVWSEGILTKAFPKSQNYYEIYPEGRSLMALIRATGCPFVIGGSYEIDRNDRAYSNAAILINRHGKFVDAYQKMHLVPFAESIPGVQHPWVKKFFRPVLGNSVGWVAGETAVLFEVPLSTPSKETRKSRTVNVEKPEPLKNTVTFGTPICFDDAFTDIAGKMFWGGAELFINITNDSWSKTKSAEYQHYAVSQYRAIEYRTPLIRTTNGGYTCIIDPKGKVLEDLPLFIDDGIAAKIPVYERKITTYARFGSWFAITLICFVLMCVIAAARASEAWSGFMSPVIPKRSLT